MRSHIRELTLFGLSLAAASPALAGSTPGYLYDVRTVSLVELPRLGGDESEARDINNHGQIVGNSLNQDGIQNAFLYQPYGNIQNIGTAVMAERSGALGINNNAEIVGSWLRNERYRPFYWHASSGFVKLSIEVQPGEDYNDQYFIHPFAINDFGQIVGRATGDYGTYEAEIPADGCHWDVPIYWAGPNVAPKVIKCSLDWWGANGAWDISSSGWIAHSDWGSIQHGYRRALALGISLEFPPPPGGSSGRAAYGVNEAGAITGQISNADGQRRAVYWNGIASTSKLLGVLSGGLQSAGNEVNDQNFVAGYSEKLLHVNGAPFKGHRAFIWHADFGMYELPSFPNGESGWVSLCEAKALDNVSDAGRRGLRIRVVGFCTKNGKHKAVRWDVYLNEHPGNGGGWEGQ